MPPTTWPTNDYYPCYPLPRKISGLTFNCDVPLELVAWVLSPPRRPFLSSNSYPSAMSFSRIVPCNMKPIDFQFPSSVLRTYLNRQCEQFLPLKVIRYTQKIVNTEDKMKEKSAKQMGNSIPALCIYFFMNSLGGEKPCVLVNFHPPTTLSKFVLGLWYNQLRQLTKEAAWTKACSRYERSLYLSESHFQRLLILQIFWLLGEILITKQLYKFAK